MKEVYRSKKKHIAEADDAEYQMVVFEDGNEFRIEQHDIEDGAIWNRTPVINLPTKEEAIVFADNEVFPDEQILSR